MEEKQLKTFEEFEEQIVTENDWVQKKQVKYPHGYISNLLFRGHTQKVWKLLTTLERFVEEKSCTQVNYTGKDYYQLLLTTLPAVSSLAQNKYELPHPSPDKFKWSGWMAPPGYDFMVYLRHHGFPSPLLDWTRSPYVAAFFAFNKAQEKDEVAIYSFREYIKGVKSRSSAEPAIKVLGPYVATHPRHYQQQCEYTICLIEKDLIYSHHEKVNFSEEQDKLTKFILPGKERKKVIEKLDTMNINEFSLFGSEESLMSTLAYREIEKKR